MKLPFLIIIIGTLGACVSTKGTIQTGATELISTPKSTKVVVFAENYNQDFKGFIADSLKQNWTPVITHIEKGDYLLKH